MISRREALPQTANPRGTAEVVVIVHSYYSMEIV